jgi:hypothetical protein
MPNQHINKVVYGNSTLIDLTADTVTADKLMQGYTAHDASGAPIVGTATGGGGTGGVTQDANGYLVLDDEGGGSSVTVEPLSVTTNGTYTAPTGTAYSPVTVSVSGGSDTDFANTIMRSGAITSIPSSVTRIGDYAFYNCTNLALTELPSGVTSIGSYAFHNCTNLALTELPSGVTSIGSYAFQGCIKLALTELPSGVTSIGSYAFYSCAKLALTALPSGVTSIGNYAFYNCTNLALTELPSGVTSIGSYAFQGCTKLALTALPSGVTSIGTSAFRSCTNLALTALPSGVTSIGGYMFSSCSNITQMDLPSVGSIASNAFPSCTKLQTLILRKSDAICTLSNVSAFTNTPLRGYNGLTGTVYVPQALISTYQTATNWSTLYNDGTVSFVAIEGSEYDTD